MVKVTFDKVKIYKELFEDIQRELLTWPEDNPYDRNVSLSTPLELLKSVITEDGLRTIRYNNLWLRQSQLNEKNLNELKSIIPLNSEEKKIIIAIDTIIGLNYFKSEVFIDKNLIEELTNLILDFLKKETETK